QKLALWTLREATTKFALATVTGLKVDRCGRPPQFANISPLILAARRLIACGGVAYRPAIGRERWQGEEADAEGCDAEDDGSHRAIVKRSAGKSLTLGFRALSTSYGFEFRGVSLREIALSFQRG